MARGDGGLKAARESVSEGGTAQSLDATACTVVQPFFFLPPSLSLPPPRICQISAALNESARRALAVPFATSSLLAGDARVECRRAVLSGDRDG